MKALASAVLLVIVLFALTSSATANAAVFRGSTAQGEQVSLRTDRNGVPTRLWITDFGFGMNLLARLQRREPLYCPAGDRDGFKAKRLLGLRVKRARNRASRHGCQLRVVRRNGEWLVVTQDYVPTRINVHVVDRRVTKIDGIG